MSFDRLGPGFNTGVYFNSISVLSKHFSLSLDSLSVSDTISLLKETWQSYLNNKYNFDEIIFSTNISDIIEIRKSPLVFLKQYENYPYNLIINIYSPEGIDSFYYSPDIRNTGSYNDMNHMIEEMLFLLPIRKTVNIVGVDIIKSSGNKTRNYDEDLFNVLKVA